jgi:hypothetical protein
MLLYSWKGLKIIQLRGNLFRMETWLEAGGHLTSGQPRHRRVTMTTNSARLLLHLGLHPAMVCPRDPLLPLFQAVAVALLRAQYHRLHLPPKHLGCEPAGGLQMRLQHLLRYQSSTLQLQRPVSLLRRTGMHLQIAYQ